MKKPHCGICQEIEAGCQKELADYKHTDRTVWRECVCHGKGFIDCGDGTGVACSECPRGYRLKLWLKHEGKEHGAIRLAA